MASVRWGEDVAPHLQSAIIELESALAAMPVSYERLLLNRALRTCTLSFRECARNLDLVAGGGAGRVERPRGVRG